MSALQAKLRHLFNYATVGTLRVDGLVGNFPSLAEVDSLLEGLREEGCETLVQHNNFMDDYTIIVNYNGNPLFDVSETKRDEDVAWKHELTGEGVYVPDDNGSGKAYWYPDTPGCIADTVRDEYDKIEVPEDFWWQHSGMDDVKYNMPAGRVASIHETFKENPDAERVANKKGGLQSHLGIEWKYLPWDAAKACVLVMMSNALEYGGKYPMNNWRKIDSADHLNHLLEHAVNANWNRHVEGNKEEEFEHATHVLCRAMMYVSMLLEEQSNGD